MEQKSLKNNNYYNLIFYRIKEMKSWLVLSLAIMIITLFIMPIVLGGTINEGIIILGFFEIATLIFIKSLIDLNYYHENKKITYYASKPISAFQQVNSIILSQLIYLGILLGVILAIAAIGDVNTLAIKDMLIVGVPWLLIGTFLTVLSSVITGNTFVAAITTLVNFTLPLSLLGIIYFCFDVVGNVVYGFNHRILFNMFIESIYRLDIIYFVGYVRNFSLDYFLVLAIILSIIYGITMYSVKKRKNERSGEFLVFDGYKSGITLLLACIVPVIFSSGFGLFRYIYDYNYSIVSQIISFVILSGLAYYLMYAILEKSFKINKKAIKIFTVFLASFFVFIGSTKIVATSFISKVPNADEISAVYLGNQDYLWVDEYKKMVNIYNANLEDFEKADEAILYTDKENIENVINLHREIIKNSDYHFNHNVVIAYFYKNGDVLYRNYYLNEKEKYDGGKDEFLNNIGKSNEYKNKRLPFVYDENYLDKYDVTKINIYDYKIHKEFDYSYTEHRDVEFDQNNLDIDILREKLRLDYDYLLAETSTVFNYFGQHNQSILLVHEYDTKYYNIDEYNTNRYSIHIARNSNKNGKPDIYFDITRDFKNTFEYISTVVKE